MHEVENVDPVGRPHHALVRWIVVCLLVHHGLVDIGLSEGAATTATTTMTQRDAKTPDVGVRGEGGRGGGDAEH